MTVFAHMEKGKKMPRLINADKLIEQITKLEREALQQTEKYDSVKDPIWWNRWNAILGERTVFKYDLIDTPTVDVEPVRYGHWIRNDNGTYSCSECHSWIPDEQHYYARYCLFCGCRMNEVE